MAYSDVTTVRRAAGGAQVLVDLCDQDNSGSDVLDTAVLNAAIADTDALIDSYVAKQRAVPLNPVPAAVARLAAEETVYRLRSQKPRAPIGEIEQQRHQENLDWLDGVAKGRITLGVDPQPAKSALVSPGVVLRDDDDDAEITASSLEGIW